MAPAESLGVLGFDISASATAIQLKDRTLWSNASNGAKVDRRLAMGGIRVHKGLPYNIDVEGFYNKASNNIGVYGGGLRWAVLPGSSLVVDTLPTPLPPRAARTRLRTTASGEQRTNLRG